MTTAVEEHDKHLETIEKLYGASFREIFNVVNAPCGESLDQLWRDIILSKDPSYGDWEYPGQAYRHLSAEYRKLATENERLKGVIDELARLAS